MEFFIFLGLILTNVLFLILIPIFSIYLNLIEKTYFSNISDPRY